MKTIRRFISTVSLVFLMLNIISCGSSKTEADKDNEFQKLKEQIQNKEFTIENEWLMPLGGNPINLIGNPNFIRFKGDSIELFLPYFGVRHMGGGYGSEGGIKYEGLAKNYLVEENSEDREINLSFETEQDTENLEFKITIFPNGNANTNVNSSQRNNISYQGEIRKQDEEEE